MQYRFTCDYTSGYGTWGKGEIAELDDATAEWLMRDVPGCIEPATGSRNVDAPARNRQVTTPPRKRGA